jgi:hypothetical protein
MIWRLGLTIAVLPIAVLLAPLLSGQVRRNFIDDDIFNQLATMNVRPARLTTDEEFIRRVSLDLTGRIPSPAAVREFVSADSGTKRDDLIDRLLTTPEFNDKWAVWLADLIQNTERLSTNGRAPQIEGRNSMDRYLRDAVANHKPISQIVTELIMATGNNYFTENGPANYPVLASAAMGPAQDTYDMMVSRTASQFLGIAHYDCLMCHNGRGHLDGITLWGGRQLRADAERMSAHFARMRLSNGAPAGAKQYADPLYNSTDVQDAASGNYNLNTTSGNRPERAPIGNERFLTPQYRDGTTPPANMNWRAGYAAKLTADPMFGRNFANRLWKQFFGLGLVDPVDTMDPDRLDPGNPPPAPWTLQASHPELLERLAAAFRERNTDLREFIRLLVQSTAYQLSSEYKDGWKYEYLTLYPRHYPRRLDAEEIHDAITQATGVPARYTWPVVNGQTVERGTPLKQSDPVEWAMQLPDVNEPRNNGAVLTFLRAFSRGNRDTSPRKQAGSILQQMSIMNDAFVLTRIKVSASPALQSIAKIQDNGSLVDELFLELLARKPSGVERDKGVRYLEQSPVRETAIEDLAWACINKLDFLFSY